LKTYLQEHAEVWEWLAYVKLRGVHGENHLATRVEQIAKQSIHSAAINADKELLRSKSYEMRSRLMEQKSGRKSRDEVNIKFDEGGLQDVYFAIRYLQLRDDIPDDPENRATMNTLDRLRDNESLTLNNYMKLKHGYVFLSELDHNLRLNVGRSNRIRTRDLEVLAPVARRMKIGSVTDLLTSLTEHRHNIREAFDDIFCM
jgi:glutamine synthetase adenylyltransferase